MAWTAVDAEIEQTISEIDEIQTRMTNARAGLEARRDKNQRINQNFKSLLCEEYTTLISEEECNGRCSDPLPKAC